ncbi:hypothetical protein THAOC_11238 [Thalassiosira oceanica]|uniref:Uncharacterized protein n=1 Tax=Thalassiosira oceanica TaxID=159749 RepID=K0T333_THAOC|nr:hypothetical protein THAOC_11238 [Thalassiosira oceanica]|eukprot:EJK67696.1 hypothetical protein THAOC_11238 [Thalassiosira oceanica]
MKTGVAANALMISVVGFCVKIMYPRHIYRTDYFLAEALLYIVLALRVLALAGLRLEPHDALGAVTFYIVDLFAVGNVGAAS